MNDDLTIRGLISILKRRRAIIAWTVSVCFLMGMIVCVFLKPRYRAFGEIEIQKSPTDGLGLENLTGLEPQNSDALDANINLQTQATILKSNSLAIKVIEDLNLEDTEDFKPTFNFSPAGWALGLITPPSRVTDPPKATLENSPHRRDRAVNVFASHLTISPLPGTRMIDIQYTNSDPKIAAAVVNDLAKSLVDYTQQSRSTATDQVSKWLGGQLGDIKKEAESLQGKVEQLQRESGVYSLGMADAQGKEIAYSATLDRLQQATQALSAATSARILKGALYKTVENGDPEMISGLAGSSLAGASPGVGNSLVLLQTLRTQQAALASQVAGDYSKLGSANPKLEDDKASLDSINANIKSEIGRIGERVANDYQQSEVVENNMRDLYDQERKSADNSNDKAIALLIAQQEATDARQLYQTLFTHLEEAGVMEGMRSSNISVVDAGRVPSKPRPDALLYLGLSLVAGCFLGLCGVMFAEATNDRIEGIATIENVLRSPVIAVLPTTQQRRRLASWTQDSEAGRVAVLEGPNTAYVEALRGLRTSILRPRSGPAPKTILITSAAEQEGKSTLSLNLAAALALNGSRVLLVDGDLRSGGLSDYIGVGRQESSLIAHEPCGLSDALSSSCDPSIIKPFRELPNLSVLAAGSSSTHPAELLGSDRMQSLARSLSSIYDCVLIDSPPILAVADALILARLADTTLLVARHGLSTQKSLERAYKALLEIDGINVGIVINGVDRNSVAYNEFCGYKGTNYYSEA